MTNFRFNKKSSILSLSLSLSLSLGLAIALSAAGCGSMAPEAGVEGGKAEVPLPGHCMTKAEMIAATRAQLSQEDPEFYSSDSFKDDMAIVESLADLNGDGVDDALVLPGMNHAGANSHQVVYLSDENGCATLNVGFFSATSVEPAEDGAVHNGVRDLIRVNNSGCQSAITRYTFDGERYVKAGTQIEDLCQSDRCASKAEMIALARAQLIQEDPGFYYSDSFKDDMAIVESLADLNGDGVDDALVLPGRNDAAENSDQLVYLSDADGCTKMYAGHFSASSVEPAEDGAVHNGVRDLIGVNNSGCDSVTTRYIFSGMRYEEGDSSVVDLCSH